MGPPFYVVCEPREGLAACSSAKGVPLFLSYFKTLSIGLVPGIEPATSRSAFPPHSSDQANTAMVEPKKSLILAFIALQQLEICLK